MYHSKKETIGLKKFEFGNVNLSAKLTVSVLGKLNQA